MRVDLVQVGSPQARTTWPHGESRSVPPTPSGFGQLSPGLPAASQADAWLFWDPALGNPPGDVALEALRRSAHAWHAGLCLGLCGLPRALDSVAPGWMLARDPPLDREATSWRVSFRAALVRTALLREAGLPSGEFQTLEAAVLEWGHRCVRAGAFLRYLPELVARGSAPPARPVCLPFEDELRFIRYRYGTKWAAWSVFRALSTRKVGPAAAMSAWRRVMGGAPPPMTPSVTPPLAQSTKPVPPSRVSVVVPTVDRYPYLRTLLGQLRAQTVPPYEVLIVDQTPPDRRDPGLEREAQGLPCRFVYQEPPGQCSARNRAILLTRGECLLFVDDDDEVPPDLIERHLANLARWDAQVSSGVAEEPGSGPLPADFRLLRVSDVFPTNNSLVRREALRRSGLFDLAYERGARADADLGMRLYLSGALMVLDPAISVLHHHAPSGGLRTHRARVVTYARSRQSLLHRALPSPTEFYRARRFFTPGQVHEMVWLAAMGTFSVRGGLGRKLLKAAVAAISLPHTLLAIRRSHTTAEDMLKRFPSIPGLD